MGCDHNCSSCGGCGSCGRDCAGSLELTAEEISMLEALGQFAFLPIARKMDDCAPVYLEDDALSPAEYSLVLQLLEKKGLISLDFDRPLGNFASEKYADFPIIGSMALTFRGQKVLEILEMQGITP